MMTERYLVTGAAGFIGSHLCRRLVSEGHDVVGLDDLTDGSVTNLADAPQVRLIKADLREVAAVVDAARGCRAIFHQGAKRSVPRSMLEPVQTAEVNIMGTLNVLEAARRSGATIVNASSSSVYGNQEHTPHREDMEPRPRSPYAASKLAAEALCSTWARAYNVRVGSLRYFNVYGPGQDPASEYAAVVPRFIMACLDGIAPAIHGDGEQSRDFTYIDDVVEANLLVARAGDHVAGRAYNIGGGRSPTSVNLLLSMIARLAGADPTPIHEPARAGDVQRTHADVSSARRDLDYEPRIDIEEGLRRTVAYFQEVAGGPSPSGSGPLPS